MKALPFPLLAALAILSLAVPAFAQLAPAQLERIAALVEEGKLDEAKIRAETLLEVYPDDPQLKQMLALLAPREKAAPTPPVNPALDRIRSALAEPPAPPSPPPAPLGATDRLEIETVLQGVQQALRLSDAAARAEKLKTLLARPVPEAARTSTAPHWLPYWQTRAVAALELKDWKTGWQAGQALLRLNALDSEDASVRQVMAALNGEGWLEKDPKALETAAQTKRWARWLGTWKADAFCNYLNKGDGYSTSSGNQSQKQTLTIELLYGQPSLKLEISMNDHDSTWRGNNSQGHQTSSSTIIPGKSTTSGRYWGSIGGTKTEASTFTTRILAVSLNDAGDILTVKTESKPDSGGAPSVGEYRYLLSADGRQLYILSKDTGQTRADFARYNGALSVCKDYTYFDAPLIVALAKQN